MAKGGLDGDQAVGFPVGNVRFKLVITSEKPMLQEVGKVVFWKRNLAWSVKRRKKLFRLGNPALKTERSCAVV